MRRGSDDVTLLTPPARGCGKERAEGGTSLWEVRGRSSSPFVSRFVVVSVPPLFGIGWPSTLGYCTIAWGNGYGDGGGRSRRRQRKT
eukprot:7182555-Pyramimonas_sp.AAC.1